MLRHGSRSQSGASSRDPSSHTKFANGPSRSGVPPLMGGGKGHTAYWPPRPRFLSPCLRVKGTCSPRGSRTTLETPDEHLAEMRRPLRATAHATDVRTMGHEDLDA